MNPLVEELAVATGMLVASSGKHWTMQDAEEWRTLAA